MQIYRKVTDGAKECDDNAGKIDSITGVAVDETAGVGNS